LSFPLPCPPHHQASLQLTCALRRISKERTVFSYDYALEEFTVDKTAAGKGGKSQPAKFKNQGEKENIRVHILIDKSSIEFFLCGGKYAAANRIYPAPESVNCDFFAKGAGITLPRLEAYQLS
ncbi:MAG: GH32 C-terminal domain-containing protein, partial [Treponema sp.]|jgi:sucrose-6-phosphate hydrolase SacC (GH32 family)|nr:GH32 C-terminal domain-containing protein [Treponema sp.]